MRSVIKRAALAILLALTISCVFAQTASTTTLTVDVNPAVVGQSVTLTAEVTGSNPTGLVTFKDGTTTIGSAYLSSGRAVLITFFSTVGTHSLAAVYAGNSSNTSSTSNTVVETINIAPTTTRLSATPNPAGIGESVSLRATVARQDSGLPSGTVTFKDGSTVLGTASVTANLYADLNISTLSGGVHDLTATYGGNAGFSGSTSTTLSLTVASKTATMTSLTTSINPAVMGSTVTLSTSVSGNSPSGTVTFKDGGTQLGTSTLSTGIASLNLTFPTAGAHTLTAIYDGDANNTASTSSSLMQAVNPAPTTITLTLNPNPAAFGQAFSFSAKVTGGGLPTGTVTFMDGEVALRTVSLPGSGTVAISGYASSVPFTRSIKAVYSGDANNAGSTSNMIIARTLDTAQMPAPAIAGWAREAGGTNGGSFAESANIYTVTNRAQLANAFTHGGNQPKIIKIVGSIDMSAGVPYSDHADQAARSTLAVPPNTTLFGNGTSAAIVNGGLSLSGVSQVIIRNIKFVAPCDVEPSKTGTIWSGSFPTLRVSASDHIWIDRNSFTDSPVTNNTLPLDPLTGQPKDCHDHAIDVRDASDYIAISYNRFELHNKAIQIGASDAATGDAGHLRVTVYRNLFSNISEAAPAVRYGQVHVFQNYYTGSKTHATYPHLFSIGAGTGAQIITSSNVFEISGASTCAAIINDAGSSVPGAYRNGYSSLNGNVMTGCSLSSTITWSIPYPLYVDEDPDVSFYAPGVKADALNSAGAGKLATTLGTALPLTSTSLTTNLTPTMIGKPVTFIATVTGTGSVPTGTITFKDGSATLGAATLSGGSASLTTTALTLGAHNITADYSGDANNTGSTSTAIAQGIVATTTTVSLTPATNPILAGQSVVLSAQVTGINPTGPVSFKEGSTTLGTAPLNGAGTASFTAGPLSIGEHVLSVTYAGDAANLTSISQTVTLVVNSGTGPSVSIVRPANGTRVTDRRTPVNGTYAATGSAVDVTRTKLLIDGVDVSTTATITPAGIYFLPSSDWSVGTHDLRLTAFDVTGNSTTAISIFSFDPAPTIYNETPNNVFTIAMNPRIGASIRDNGTGIQTSSIRLLLDGVDVTSLATIGGNAVSYQPTGLVPGIHTVGVRVSSNSAQAASLDWKFTVLAPPPASATGDGERSVRTVSPSLAPAP